MGRHADDVTGLLLVSMALVVGAGVYGVGGGLAGRTLADAAATIFGWLRFGLPVGLLVTGVALILWRPGVSGSTEDAASGGADGERPSVGAHLGVGATLLAVAAGGLAHHAGGSPTFNDPARDLRAAGGWFGFAVGTPLRNLLGAGGSIATLALLAVVGLVVLTRTPLRDRRPHVRRHAPSRRRSEPAAARAVPPA